MVTASLFHLAYLNAPAPLRKIGHVDSSAAHRDMISTSTSTSYSSFRDFGKFRAWALGPAALNPKPLNHQSYMVLIPKQ